MSLRSCPNCGSDEVLVDVVAHKLLALAAVGITLVTFGLGAVSFWFVPKQNLCQQCAYHWQYPSTNYLRHLGWLARAHARYYLGTLSTDHLVQRLSSKMASWAETLASTAAMASWIWSTRLRPR